MLQRALRHDRVSLKYQVVVSSTVPDLSYGEARSLFHQPHQYCSRDHCRVRDLAELSRHESSFSRADCTECHLISREFSVKTLHMRSFFLEIKGHVSIIIEPRELLVLRRRTPSDGSIDQEAYGQRQWASWEPRQRSLTCASVSGIITHRYLHGSICKSCDGDIVSLFYIIFDS